MSTCLAIFDYYVFLYLNDFCGVFSKLIAPSERNFLDEEPAPAIPFTSCPLLNISQCDSSENQDSFVVTIYNPLSKPVTKFVKVPVTSSNYSVRDPTGTKL